MKSINNIPHLLLLPVIALFAVIPNGSNAQISLTAENMALGGGGTAYLTGYESLFVNPANIYITEKSYSYQLSLFQGAYYYDSLLPINNNLQRLNRFREGANFYDPANNRLLENESMREDLVERSFGDNHSSRQLTTQSDIYWVGIKWVRPKRSYAVSLRSRFASQYELGRGFYSSSPIHRGGSFEFNQSFRHRYQSLHELSIGYAESFTYLNGLIPQLSEFIIGIAPKIVLSGAYLDSSFDNTYHLETEGGFWVRELAYHQQTSGVLSEQARQYFAHQSPDLNPELHSFSDLFQPTGIGLGLDIGLTYLITFGDDLSVLRRQDDPTDQSLRISFSVTDLGAVYHRTTPYEFQSVPKTITTEQTSSVYRSVYGGSINEHYRLLTEFGNELEFEAETDNAENFSVLLPTSIHTGALFQYRRLKLMGDLSYSIARSAFNNAGLISYFGMEIRPVRSIPLRTGTRIGGGLPGYFSFGTGFETNRFDLNAAVQVKTRNSGPTSEIVAASLLGIKFYLQ